MLIRHFLLLPFLALSLNSAQGQTRPADFDLAPALAKINDTADPQQATAILNALPDAALPALHAASEDPALSLATRDIIFQTLPALHARARAARLAQDRHADDEWANRTGRDAYKSVGLHNSAWDDLVLNAFNTDNPSKPEQSFLAYKAAIDAGCNDPMVRYYYTRRGLTAKKITDAQAVPLYLAATKDMDKSRYSAGRKFHVRVQLIRCIIDQPSAPTADQITLSSTYVQAIDLLPSIGGENISPLALNEDARLLYLAGNKIGFSHEHDFNDIYPTLKKLTPDRASTHAFAAEYYIDWAWDARGSGTANTVTDDGWKLFNDRLKLAEDTATSGFNLDPTNGECPAFMITVCMGLSYDRTIMEKWFQRAMLADPDNFHACSAKFNFLMPRWGGSEAAMLEFGRQCLANGTAKNRIPLLLLSAHEDIAESAPNSADYLSQPKVWADTKAVYEKLLADKSLLLSNRSQYLADRSNYIRHAADSKQWAEALDLMNQFGDEINLDAFGGKAMYNFYKKKAAQELTKAPT